MNFEDSCIIRQKMFIFKSAITPLIARVCSLNPDYDICRYDVGLFYNSVIYLQDSHNKNMYQTLRKTELFCGYNR